VELALPMLIAVLAGSSAGHGPSFGTGVVMVWVWVRVPWSLCFWHFVSPRATWDWRYSLL